MNGIAKNRDTQVVAKPDQELAAWNVSAPQQIEYHVEVSPNLLDPNNNRIASWCGQRTLVVIDHSVEAIYGERIRRYFHHSNIAATTLVLSADEASKELSSMLKVSDAMSDVGLLRRSESVVVFGGGVVMDVVGLAASLFRRGVPYVRVPTTLIGQVDAGVGVKTGVNRGQHKNRLGTYFPPAAALIDPTFLSSLPPRHVRNGLAEIVKIALVKDLALLELLETSQNELTANDLANCASPDHLQILTRAIGGMLEELESNLHETVLERLVDFGHTFSPALELIAEPPLLHGEAVAIDMAVTVGISKNRGLIDETIAERVLVLIVRLGLPLSNPMFTPALLQGALEDTIKHRDGHQRVPLINGLGTAIFVNDITVSELAAAVDYVSAFDRAPSWHLALLNEGSR